MNEFTIVERLAALERQSQLLVDGFNAISNDKVPRISLRKLEAISAHLSTISMDLVVDNDEISDIESAIYDAKNFSEKASQEVRRMRAALDVNRFLIIKLLLANPNESANEILGAAAEFIDGIDPGKIVRRYSGLEQRAAHKEIEEFQKILTVTE